MTVASKGPYKERKGGTLKEAQAALVRAAGGVKAPCRIAKSQLAACTDPDQPERNLPVDVVMALEDRAREPIVTRYLAARQNHLLVKLPEADAEPYPLALGRITTETGELLAMGGAAIRAGTMTPSQAHMLMREALQIAAACGALVADCRTVLAAAGAAAGAGPS